MAPVMKQAANMRWQHPHTGTKCPKVLYKSARIVEIVIVEDVLVLVCERLSNSELRMNVCDRRCPLHSVILFLVMLNYLVYNKQ